IERGAPLPFLIFPAELPASAAVFIVRLQNEILAAATHVLQQAERFSVARGLAVRGQARPGNVSADQLAFGTAEERGILLVRKYSEKSLLVRNLAGKRIGHANCTGSVSAHQNRTLCAARDDVVNQHTPINEINALAMGHQSAFRENQITRIR